jgi:hypothetical protein
LEEKGQGDEKSGAFESFRLAMLFRFVGSTVVAREESGEGGEKNS